MREKKNVILAPGEFQKGRNRTGTDQKHEKKLKKK
jgi:hypothetical protein